MITVIIPLYNRSSLISFTLQSLVPENHPDVELEVLVIDDASIDNGPAVVQQEFPWVKLIRNDVNKGASECRNQGISLASGEFIFFLDSDDLVERNFFSARLGRLQQNNDLIGVYGPWIHFESDNTFHENQLRPRKSVYPLYESGQRNAILENLMIGWYIPINATVWRTQAVRNTGGFIVGLEINQDVDFCFRLLSNGQISGIKAPHALIRQHKGERVGQSISEDRLKQMLELRKRFIHDLEKHNLRSQRYDRALGTYTFHLWSQYRKQYPDTVGELLKLSQQLNPNLRLKGSLWFRILATLTGNVTAVKIKHLLQRQ